MNWFPVEPTLLIIAMGWTAVAASLQGTLGFGFAICSVPVLSLIDPVLAPVPQLLVGLPLTLSMAIRERKSLDLAGIKWVVGGRIVGALAGLALLAIATQTVLDVAIASIVVAAVIALVTVPVVVRNPITESIAGFFSGASALISSIGGPPLAVLYRDAAGGTLRSSLGAIFAIGIVITIGVRALGDQIAASDLVIAVWLFPMVLIGIRLSSLWIGRVEGPFLRRGILIVATVSAIGLFVRAFGH